MGLQEFVALSSCRVSPYTSDYGNCDARVEEGRGAAGEEGDGRLPGVGTMEFRRFVAVITKMGRSLRGMGEGEEGSFCVRAGHNSDTKRTFPATYLLRQRLLVPELSVAPLNP